MKVMSTFDTTERDGTCEMYSGADPDPKTHERCRKRATHVGLDEEGDQHLLCRGHMQLVEHVFDVRPLPHKPDERP